MSEDQEDININELVGNLLAAHNEQEPPQSLDENLGDQELSGLHENVVADDDIQFGDDDLAAVVAQAIGNINDEEEQTADGASEKEKESYHDSIERGNDLQSKEEEWAHILQQGLLQATQDTPQDSIPNDESETRMEHLDQEDETLRMAILDSLQQLSVGEESANVGGKAHTSEHKIKDKTKDHDKDKAKDKKAKKREAKKAAKKKSSKKKKEAGKKVKSSKKSSKQPKTTAAPDDDILNFEDVIRGFMEQSNVADSTTEQTYGNAQVASGSNEINDAETQAIVEATLRAFETELIGGSSSVSQKPSTSDVIKKKPQSSKKPSSTKTKSKKSAKTTAQTPATTKDKSKATQTSKKNKSSKKGTGHQESYDEDEFSRALAEMVSQVVNSSITDTQSVPPEEQIHQKQSGVSESLPPMHTHTSSQDVADTAGTDEGFDLNQIMQNAMAMAFQDDAQGETDSTTVEGFNRDLNSVSVSDLLSSTKPTRSKKKSTSKKKHSTDKSATTAKTSTPNKHKAQLAAAAAAAAAYHEGFNPLLQSGADRITDAFSLPLADQISVTSSKRSPKPQASPEQLLRKRYSLAANAAASEAKKRLSKKNKEARLKVREERRIARTERKLKKEEDKQRQAEERKELEGIVAKGPPYPLDLRLTKSGKPKKPYRRYTSEEMAKRAALPPDELNKTRKVRKERKKEKKPKKIPLSTLKKIPLFNFIKGNVPFDVKNKLNDIDGTLARIPLATARAIADRDAAVNSKLKQGDLPTISHQRSLVNLDSEDRNGSFKKGGFDPSHKTVVHREKIQFHPPWTMPSYPPLALPVARRKKKDKGKKGYAFKRASKNHRSSRSRNQTLNFVSGNKIVPAALFPIINTLKAAAKAKAAAGATPEEASKHLGAMLQHARLTIAQTLAAARGQAHRNYASIRTQEDIKKVQKRNAVARRIPIFNLASIKTIDTEDSGSAASTTDNNRGEKKKEAGLNPTSIESSSAPSISKQSSEGLASTQIQKENSVEINIEKTNAQPTDNSDNFKVQSPKKNVQNAYEPSAKAVNLYPTKVVVQKELSNKVEGLPEPVVKLESQIHIPTGQAIKGIIPEDAQQSSTNEKSHTRHMQPSSLDESGVSISQQSSEISHAETDMVENIVKQQLSMPEGSRNELPPEYGSILSSTIAGLIAPQEKTRKKYTKRPQPTLNLEGLVPPSMKPKTEPMEVGEIFNKSEIVRPEGAAKEKSVSSRPSAGPGMVYEFKIPTKDIHGNPLRAISMLRRAKKYLSDEDMGKLKKSVNNERKRKWREANGKKNKDHDLRARLRKRANMLYGEQETRQKNDWFEEEYAKRVIKLEHASADLPVAQHASEPTTTVSDIEILNMIAVTFNNLEAARTIEKDINEEANLMSNDNRNPLKKRTKEKSNIPMPIKVDTPKIIPNQVINNGGNAESQSEVWSSTALIDPALEKSAKRIRQDGNDADEADVKKPKLQFEQGESIERPPITSLHRPGYINTENN